MLALIVLNVRTPRKLGTGVWPFFVALFEAAEIEEFAKHKKVTGREEGFIPALPDYDSPELAVSRRAGINPSSRPVI